MEMCGHRHASPALSPGKNPATHWIGWVGPRAGLCVGGKEKNLLSMALFETRIVQPVAWSLYRLHYPASVVYVRYEICTRMYSFNNIHENCSILLPSHTPYHLSNPKPLAQLPLAVPSIDFQLKTWRSEFRVPVNAASSTLNCIPRLHARH
jgi:hypothetical protein